MSLAFVHVKIVVVFSLLWRGLCVCSVFQKIRREEEEKVARKEKWREREIKRNENAQNKQERKTVKLAKRANKRNEEEKKKSEEEEK